MPKNLVIVESPAKAKTIEKFLGKDFEVKSSYGHIRDLPSKGMNIAIEDGTFAPTYAVNDDKKKIVTELKKAAKDKEVWLASDEDREGEAIAWHICHALKLDPKKTKRIVFHEITKPAILAAVEKPRTVNQPLVDAQQARRVLDRLVGYSLSPVLWKKVQTGLSAGRVQSVAVRIIVERERAIESFESDSNFKATAEFDLGKGAILKAEISKKFSTREEAKTFVESCVGADFTVKNLETKPAKKSPAAPFTTSTLQQEASRKLGYSVKQTMIIAQKLYEAGKITYMRTDSVNLSEQAIKQAALQIETKYGEASVQTRRYKTKSGDAQEAHEAIRPTDFSVDTAGADAQAKKLYNLIWKRSIASQMADAKIEKTTAQIAISTSDQILTAQGEVIQFPGFLEVYIEGSDDDNDDALSKKMLPPLTIGQALELKYLQARETFSRPPARFTEASLVKKLEEEGIGRPSTYAPTISTIMNRNYVEKKDKDGTGREYEVIVLKDDKVKETKESEITGTEKNKLFPTALGEVVSDFLVNHFSDVVDYGFTRQVEEEFDSIAEGKKAWNKMIKDFYGPFDKTIKESADISRESAMQIRELGLDPKTKKPITARIGRFGPMIQMGTKDDEEKPRFASIPEGKDMRTITFGEALELFSLPRLVGQTKEGEDIKANFGRFGPYVQVGKLFVSIKPEDPLTITLEKSRELIDEKKEKEKNKYIAEWPEKEIQLLRGPYGIYIKHGKKNVRIPKTIEKPEKLKLPEIEKIIKEAPDKPKRKFTRKKK